MFRRWYILFFSLALFVATASSVVAGISIADIGFAEATDGTAREQKFAISYDVGVRDFKPESAAAGVGDLHRDSLTASIDASDYQPDCPAPSCDNNCAVPLWTPTISTWRVQADALFLSRSGPRSEPLIVNAAGDSIFNANQFRFPTQIGWALDLSRRINDNWEVETRYFDLGSQSARTSPFVGDNGAGVVYNHDLFQSIGIFETDATSVLSYASRLQSIEINARRAYSDRFAFLTGIRYVNLNDGILVVQQANGGSVDARQQLHAFNDMVGWQVGADTVLWRRGRLSFNTLAKAGIYSNASSNNLSYDSNFFGVHTRTNAKTTNTAFLGEMGFIGRYEMSQRWSLRGGYQLMWLDGVAEAYQQPAVNTSPIDGPATRVRTTGDIFYNGAFIGMEYRR